MEGSARIIIQEGGAPPPDPRILPLAPVRHAGDCHVDGGVILRGGGRPLKQAREASDTGAIKKDILRPFSSTAIPASLQGFLLQVLRPAWGRRAFYNSFLGEGDGSAPALSDQCRFCARLFFFEEGNLLRSSRSSGGVEV